jgi:hypothetical protein
MREYKSSEAPASLPWTSPCLNEAAPASLLSRHQTSAARGPVTVLARPTTSALEGCKKERVPVLWNCGHPSSADASLLPDFASESEAWCLPESPSSFINLEALDVLHGFKGVSVWSRITYHQKPISSSGILHFSRFSLIVLFLICHCWVTPESLPFVSTESCIVNERPLSS